MSTTDEIEAMLGEAGLEDADDVRRVLLAMHSTTLTETPRPSAELAGRLVATARSATPRRPRRRVALGLTAAALTTVVGTGMAAAANELPAPAQRLVAGFSEHFLPFAFPRPDSDAPTAPRPDVTRPNQDHPAKVPGPTTPEVGPGTGVVVHHHRGSGEQHRQDPAREHAASAGPSGTRPAVGASTGGLRGSGHGSSGSGTGQGSGDDSASSSTSRHSDGQGSQGNEGNEGNEGSQGGAGGQGGTGDQGSSSGQGGQSGQGGNDSSGAPGADDSGNSGTGGQGDGGQGDGGSDG